jgi:hypothetical protein
MERKADYPPILLGSETNRCFASGMRLRIMEIWHIRLDFFLRIIPIDP